MTSTGGHCQCERESRNLLRWLSKRIAAGDHKSAITAHSRIPGGTEWKLPRSAWMLVSPGSTTATGRYHEAMVAAQEGSEYPDDLSFAAWSMVELIEAAVRSGRVPQAVDALGRLIQCTAHSENNSTLGIVARCRALLEDGAQAEALFLEAIQRLEDTHVRGELARAHLLYGEWLRREGRRVDGREDNCGSHMSI